MCIMVLLFFEEDDMKKVLAVFVAVLISLTSTGCTNEATELVLSGERVLLCHFKGEDGYRKVPKEKVIGFNTDLLFWEFENGYAKNCITKKPSEYEESKRVA